MEYKPRESKLLCLECGGEISYGRTDKKYCCETCRNRNHNREKSLVRSRKGTVLKAIEKNYGILDSLYRQGIDGITIPELNMMGFNENCVTSWRKWRNRTELMCFDLRFFLTPSRIYGLSRVVPPEIKRR